MDTLSVPVLLGTTRSGRRSEVVANFIVEQIKQRGDMAPRLFDVRDFSFPQDGYGPALKDEFPEWKEAIEEADALVIVTPEYNHGYPGPLKSVLDLLFPEYKHKAVGIVSVSNGRWGGTRAVENLIPIVADLGMSIVIPALNFPEPDKIFDEKGNLQDENYTEFAAKFLGELAWLAKTLRWGREHVKVE